MSRETRLKPNYLEYVSLIFHILFWFCAGWWEVAAGEAGSPLPDNWESLLLQSKVSSSIAVICLVISIGCGVSMVATKRWPPVSSVISLLLLGPTLLFCWSMLTTKVF
jgi:hypothetical protein